MKPTPESPITEISNSVGLVVLLTVMVRFAEPRFRVLPVPPRVRLPELPVPKVTLPVKVKLFENVRPVAPLTPKEVPSAIVMLPEPRTLELEVATIPPFEMFTNPEKEDELLLSKVSVPEPDFSNVPVPESVPEKVTEPVSATVSVWPAAMEAVPPVLPPPWREPMVSLEATWRMAPAVFAKLTTPVLEMALPPLSVRFPAEMVVVPE